MDAPHASARCCQRRRDHAVCSRSRRRSRHCLVLCRLRPALRRPRAPHHRRDIPLHRARRAVAGAAVRDVLRAALCRHQYRSGERRHRWSSALYFAAFMAEVFRGAVLAVPRKASGRPAGPSGCGRRAFSPTSLLPQALRVAGPPYINTMHHAREGHLARLDHRIGGRDVRRSPDRGAHARAI